MTVACKSPSHAAYARAAEAMDVSAGLIAAALHEARVVHDQSERQEAVRAAMAEAAERIAWAQTAVALAERGLQTHFGRGCAAVDALAICNSCDANPADPSSAAGYCRACME